jgi:hypothetical protein
MHDNERGFHGRHVIDKGITRGVHDLNSVGCPDMPGGLTSMTPLNADPHGRGFKMPIGDVPSSRAPRDVPREMRPPHMVEPHRYGADPGPRESDIVTPRSKP